MFKTLGSLDQSELDQLKQRLLKQKQAQVADEPVDSGAANLRASN